MNDRAIFLVIPLVAAVVGFWMLVYSPKQDEVKKLDDQIATLQGSISEQEQQALAGQQARKGFPRDYQQLVVLGKAVPVEDETASFVVQLNQLAGATGVNFNSIRLRSDGAAAAPVATAPSPTPAPAEGTEAEGSEGSSEEEGSEAAAAPAPVAAVPTEATAASLPIGATVGSAGLPTLPYDLIFRGNYFEIADFMASVDRLVGPRKGTIAVDGRLVTINGFTLETDEQRPFPFLKATLSVTTYVAPADQGLTGGATPTAPAAVATPTSAPVAP